MEFNNKYYILRHGEALSNVKDVLSCWPEKFNNPLTEKGEQQIKKSAKELRDKSIDMIFSSDLLRARETAEIVGKELNIKPKLDKRLREQNVGVLNGQPIEKIREFFGERRTERFKLKPKKGERYVDIEKRMASFIKDIDKKYKRKNILIVSHELPLIMLEKWLWSIPADDFYKIDKAINNGQIKELVS
jgi:broad specificity phosphatase PhoE